VFSTGGLERRGSPAPGRGSGRSFSRRLPSVGRLCASCRRSVRDAHGVVRSGPMSSGAEPPAVRSTRIPVEVDAGSARAEASRVRGGPQGSVRAVRAAAPRPSASFCHGAAQEGVALLPRPTGGAPGRAGEGMGWMLRGGERVARQRPRRRGRVHRAEEPVQGSPFVPGDLVLERST